MSRMLRPLMIVVAVLWILRIPRTIPGLEWPAESGAISVGILLKQGFNPWVFAAFVLGGLIGGRGRGLLAGLGTLFGVKAPKLESKRRAAACALLGATRGLLWGSFAILLVSDLLVYQRVLGPGSPMDSESYAAAQAIMDTIRMGGFLMLPLLVFVLLPGAASLGSGLSAGRPWLRRVDLACLAGYAALALVPPLSLFVARHAIVGVENSAVYWLPPSLDVVNPAFIAWSLIALVALAALAFMLRGAGQSKMPWGKQSFSIDLYLLASGALVSSTVRAATMQNIANGAGAGNPDEFQRLGGCMLVTLALALGLICLRRLLAGARTSKLEAALD